MNQAVDAIFDFDKGAEVGEIANASFHRHANRELLMQRIPWIGSQLTHAERNAALRRVHVEHDALDLIADIDQLRGMLHALRPSHLTDVDESFNSLLEFDERSVVSYADHASADMCTFGIAMLGIEPGIRRELLES